MIKRIDIDEFQEKGYLQEANRLFFHPLGLALEVIVDEEDGSMKLGGIWDYRNDPEGIVFDDFDPVKQAYISGRRQVRMMSRRVLGCCDANGIQILPHRE